jgi:hypothetical protein
MTPQQLRDAIYAQLGNPTTVKDKALADAVKALADQIPKLTLPAAPPVPPVVPVEHRSGHERRKVW